MNQEVANKQKNISSLLVDSLTKSQYTEYEAQKIANKRDGEKFDGTFPVRISSKFYPHQFLDVQQSGAAYAAIMRKINQQHQVELRPKLLKYVFMAGYCLIPCLDASSAKKLQDLVPQLKGQLLKFINKNKATAHTLTWKRFVRLTVEQMNEEVDSEHFTDPIINAIVGSYMNGDEEDQCANSVTRIYRSAANIANDQFNPSGVVYRGLGTVANQPGCNEPNQFGSIFHKVQQGTTSSVGINRFNPYGMPRYNGTGDETGKRYNGGGVGRNSFYGFGVLPGNSSGSGKNGYLQP